MTNATVLSEKQAIVAALAEKMKNASSGVLVDYKGINVEQDTKLRRTLREHNVEYAVVKNTLARFAAKQVGFDALDPILNGTTAIAISMEDSILPSKLLVDFAKDNPKVFQIKAGFVDGAVVDKDTIESLSKLQSKEILLATVLGTLNAPIGALARALNAILEQKGGAPAEAAAEEAQAATNE